MTNKPPYAILSYPRSGNHWTRYILEHFSGRPTLGSLESPLDTPIASRTKKGVDLDHVDIKSPPIAQKSHLHDSDSSRAFMESFDGGLIVITRNWRNCIPRHLSKKSNFKEGQIEIDRYFAILQYYEDYAGDKLLLRYEEFVAEAERFPIELYKLLRFTETYECEAYINFLQDFKTHLVQGRKSLLQPAQSQSAPYDSYAKSILDVKEWEQYIGKNYSHLSGYYQV